MTISSVILRVNPDKLPQIKARLGEFPGVELHAATDDGRLIVTVEDAPDMSAADCYVQLNLLDGVLSAAVVYEYSGDLDTATA